MDRVISDEERIRRAEDIIERRKNTDLRISSDNFVREKSNNKIGKMLCQILVCLIIYCSVYYVKNCKQEKYNYIMDNVNNILNYDVNFFDIYNKISEGIKNFNNLLIESQKNEDSMQNQETSVQNESEPLSINEDGAGDSNSEKNERVEETSQPQEETTITNEISENQEENAPNYEKYGWVKPINNYNVTSEFGEREGNSTVSSNHKGIDLAAPVGTDIFSALDGNVLEASSYGDFGNHLKIQTDNVIVTYAHCNKIYVKQGDEVTKGEKIAEVGSTGKSTGPHLHFEIRIDSRAIDPRLVMEL